VLVLQEEFRVYLPDFIPLILEVINNDNKDRKNTSRVFGLLNAMGSNLDGYLHLIVPAIAQCFENPEIVMSARRAALQTVKRLCVKVSFEDIVSKILHPIARVISKSEAGSEISREAMNTLCALVSQLAIDYVIFIPMFNKIITEKGIKEPAYEQLVSKLLKNELIKEERSKDVKTRPIRSPSAAGGKTLSTWTELH
jgi:FKBP12-rapamycin complex-associated protein